MKAWITKYALTQGVYEVDGEIADTSPSMLIVRRANGNCITEYYHGEGKNWHRTFEAATAHADKVRSRRIQSLNKQIAKLQKLDFTRMR